MPRRDVHLSAQACERLSEWLGHFSNPLRLRLICQLSGGEKCVGELIEATGAKQSTVSGQLRYLAMAGVVRHERRGTNVYYRLADQRVRRALQRLARDFV